MAMKHYPPEFKADTGGLYESRPEAMIRSVAADLGVNPETLRNWVRAAGASLPRGGRRGCPPSRPRRWRPRTRPLRKKVRELARSWGRRRSISPGRRAGEEL
ncbi:transposase [Streptomyces spiralis]|uniref:transposase n=1 Tax=Streptomyces spiralis TaxID=66376 RepID=UPI0036CA3D56